MKSFWFLWLKRIPREWIEFKCEKKSVRVQGNEDFEIENVVVKLLNLALSEKTKNFINDANSIALCADGRALDFTGHKRKRMGEINNGSD